LASAIRRFLVLKNVLACFLTLAAGLASAQENASNPLASVNNVDVKSQYTSNDPLDRHDIFIDGAHMFHPKLKVKYELHYNVTDATGTRENDFEKLVFKPIYFISQSKLNDSWGFKIATGFDWVLEFNNEAKGIGVGADTIAPFGALAFAHLPSGMVILPLVQHFVAYKSSDTDVNTTAGRLIMIRPFGKGYWAKLDAKVPYDWENEKWIPTAEVQLGYNFNQRYAMYVESLIGVGKDRPYDAGVGVGLRFKY
jgi:hypothetical protein